MRQQTSKGGPGASNPVETAEEVVARFVETDRNGRGWERRWGTNGQGEQVIYRLWYPVDGAIAAARALAGLIAQGQVLP